MRRPALVLALSAPFVFTACGGGGGVGDALGMGRRAPDEFQVVQRAPLTLPPNFALRPPEPGAARPQEGTPAQRAQVALTGAPMPVADATPGQAALLASAGAATADPEIRMVLANETEGMAGLDLDRFWFILDFQRRAFARAQQTPLDAQAEAQRLREAGINVRSVRVDTQTLPGSGGG
ncbi:MAG: DUF3035 domain-containing protein [Geminicoccaceae bacterium]|nr:MAG: DUF3035 domain-containing protein [Geminicoccaceae bacterium]